MDEARARELLTAERRRIEEALYRLDRGGRDDELSHVDQHPGDQGTAMYENERDEGVAESMREELAAIGRAEERLEEGTYGLSVESGEPIPDGRLEIVPFAERTATEQSRYDRAR